MRLQDLIDILPEKTVNGDVGVEIRGLNDDSRDVEPGQLFFAIRGYAVDGHRYIADAVANGAAAVIVEDETNVPAGVTWVRVPDGRIAMALVAAQYHGHPTKHLRLIGVTGTKGKTTTTTLTHAILNYAGIKTGLIGTNRNLIGDQEFKAIRTTPESLDLQAFFAAMVDVGCSAAVMEVASHALSLNRVAACEYDIVALTNVARDHLDFYGTVENYTAAKEQLFRIAGQSYFGEAKSFRRAAVINADDANAARMAAASAVPVLTYGIEHPADLHAVNLRLSPTGTRYDLQTEGTTVPIRLRLVGKVNVYNSLAAIGICRTAGVDLSVIAAALAAAPPVKGRFEPVDVGQPFSVIVDYAHTEDSLENLLLLAKEFVGPHSRVIAVFGCGGDRDRGKRPGMGRLAVTLADHAIVTSDNPRTEDPERILDEVEAGMTGGKGRYERIADRRVAIGRAIELAHPGDIVLIAGKGHETYQIIGTETIHFDDREVAREFLSGRGN